MTSQQEDALATLEALLGDAREREREARDMRDRSIGSGDSLDVQRHHAKEAHARGYELSVYAEALRLARLGLTVLEAVQR